MHGLSLGIIKRKEQGENNGVITTLISGWKQKGTKQEKSLRFLEVSSSSVYYSSGFAADIQVLFLFVFPVREKQITAEMTICDVGCY